MNGIVRAGDGISKYNYTWPAVVVAPRFGFAYDVTGAQRMVVRGGIGLFHDRPAGDTMDSQVGNPGFSTSRTVRYALLQQLSSGLEILGPPQLTSVWPYEAEIPSSTQWNAGIQMALPWASTIDVSYVGLHGFHQLREMRGQTQVDINAVDLGRHFSPGTRIRRWRRAAPPARRRIRPICCGRTAASVRSGSTSRTSTRPITRSRRR